MEMEGREEADGEKEKEEAEISDYRVTRVASRSSQESPGSSTPPRSTFSSRSSQVFAPLQSETLAHSI